MSDGVLILDLENRVLEINPAACDMVGCSREFVVGRPVTVILQSWTEMLAQAGKIINSPVEVLVDETHWIELYTSTRFDEEGNFAGYLIEMREVTERGQAGELQAALYRIAEVASADQELDELYRQVHAQVRSLLTAENFYIAFYNPETGLLQFPYFVDQFDPRPQPRKLMHGMTEYILRKGQPALVDLSLFRRLKAAGEVEDSGTPSVNWLGVPLKTNAQKVAGVMAVQSYEEDILYSPKDLQVLVSVAVQMMTTIQRRQAEKALKSSEERLSQLTASMEEAIWLRDTNTLEVLYVNPAYEKIWGRSLESLYQDPTSFLDAVHPEDIDRVMLAIKAQFSGRPFDEEYRILRPDGSMRWIHGRTFFIKDLRGQNTRITAVAEDITVRKNMELAEGQQRLFTEALLKTSNALNSTLELDEVFKIILTNVQNFITHDSADLMIIEGDHLRVACRRGYSEQWDARIYESVPWKEFAGLQQIYETRQPLIIPDVHEYPGWITISPNGWIRAYMGLPLQMRGQVVGFLNLNSMEPGAFTADDGARLQVFADLASKAMENAWLYAEVQQLAIMDDLTGIYNRRGLFAFGRHEVERALRFQRPLAALFIDIDHFKQFNDAYSYSTGDLVLQQLAQGLAANLREIDLVGRYGGEEFVVLLPETDPATACQVAERLRFSVEDDRLATEWGDLHVTVSIGVSAMSPGLNGLEALLEYAGEALHLAKESGRNRVVLLPPGAHPAGGPPKRSTGQLGAKK